MNLHPFTWTLSSYSHCQGLSLIFPAIFGLSGCSLLVMCSLIMCTDAADLRQKAGWDGAYGSSRRRLLFNLQSVTTFLPSICKKLSLLSLGYIPSSLMIPPRRFVTLLDQARLHQISQCIYHNAPLTSQHFSLYADHTCDTDLFPRITTTILQVHNDEVWSLEWSHSGKFLASASKDKSVIIWSVGVCVILLLNTVGSYAMF
jgi:WD repeat-containing protein 26